LPCVLSLLLSLFAGVALDGVASALEPGRPLGRVISDDLLGALCVFAEARSEPYEGQVAVGCVIRNRTKAKFFSLGTVASTIAMPYQFSWMNTSDTQRARVLSALWEDPAFKVALEAWAASEHTNPVGDALFYHADYVSPYWSRAQSVEFVKRIGRHLFYRRIGQ